MLQVLIDAQAFPPTESQLAELLANTPVLCVFGGEDSECLLRLSGAVLAWYLVLHVVT